MRARAVHFVVLGALLGAAAGCRGSSSSQPANATSKHVTGGWAPDAPDARTSAVHLVGVVRLPDEGGFHGVVLDTADGGGARWIVSYERDALLATFEGRRVEVDGERYEPAGEAVMGPHVRVGSLKLVQGERDAPWIAAHEERLLEGRFVEHAGGPPGSKLADERQTFFVTAAGEEMRVASAPPRGERWPLDEPVKVRARAVEPSPTYAASAADTYLWVSALAR